MRNESSFGEKEGECFHKGPLPPPPPPPNRLDERGDGQRALRNVRFISESKSEPVSLLFFASDVGEL